MLGRVQKNEKFEFSEEKVYQVLSSDKFSRDCCCFKFPYLLTIEDAKKYLFKVKIMVFQLFVVVGVITVVGVIVLIIDEDTSSQDASFIIIQIFRIGSIIILIFALSIFCNYVGQLPEMEKIRFYDKVKVIRFLIIFAEIQLPILQILASLDLIANTDKYSTEDIVSYTYSLMIGSEMAIVAVLFLYNFPVSDYDEFVDLKSETPLLKEINEGP